MRLAVNYIFKNHGNWSLDAAGGSATGGSVIDAVVPVGSHVEAAFLYASQFLSGPTTGPVKFDGITVNSGDFTPLGVTSAASLQAFRADVTSLVASEVGGGSASPFHFTISDVPSGNIDGYELAIVYSNPSEATRSVVFDDGNSAPSGDSFTINSDANRYHRP